MPGEELCVTIEPCHT